MTAMPSLDHHHAVRSSVRLRLLGTFRLEVDDEVVRVSLGTRRLLAILGLRGRMSRPRLAGTLWPETSQAQALTNLRHVLWRLQCSLPGHVLVHAAGTELELAPYVQCDVVRLEEEARHLWSGAPELVSADQLRGAVTELLLDWDDDWVVGDRERLRQLHLHALEAYAELLLSAGRFGPALEVALTALAADVLRESAHRTVIRVHSAEGNVSEARRALDRCRRILDADLGIAPSAETLALVP
jgi:DNA-binding SARP family transcriptional activator